MIDNSVPTNQFHPYQPTDAVPHRETPRGGLSSMLGRVGSMRNMNVQQSIDKARGYAQRNPSAVLGGLAALAIGLGLMRGRR